MLPTVTFPVEALPIVIAPDVVPAVIFTFPVVPLTDSVIPPVPDWSVRVELEAELPSVVM